jgi:hypothetical protein
MPAPPGGRSKAFTDRRGVYVNRRRPPFALRERRAFAPRANRAQFRWREKA